MSLKQKSALFVVCDNLRSLENIGSIFRTADAFGLKKIYLTGICGQPPQPKIAKTALGAENWVAWQHDWQSWRLLDKLKKQGIKIVALEQTKKAIAVNKFQPKFPLALVIGNEVRGVSKAALKRADQIISIPMLGQKESLNVAVAFGIAVNYLCQQRFTGIK